MFHFVGRSSDLLRLEALWRKRTSSLVTCRGRRRIGKSTLIEEFARRTADHLTSLDGQAPGAGVDNALQLRSFVEQLSSQTSAPTDFQPDVRFQIRRPEEDPQSCHVWIQVAGRNRRGAGQGEKWTSSRLVEIKRRQHIGKDVVTEIEEKVRRLGFSSSIRTALVYEGDLEPTIRTDRQLDFIIPVARLA